MKLLKKNIMFTPVNNKLNTLIPDPKEIDAFNHFSTIVEKMIANGHAAHQSIPGYDECKPEIECFKIFEGITIPVHGYADLKGKMIIEDKCKFPRRGRPKKDGTRSWLTTKLPETLPETNQTQVDFYYYATGLPIYVCYINEDTFKVFHKDNCETLQPESMMSRLESFKQKCKVRQNLLKISDNPKVIKDYIQPDFSHFFWKNDLDPDYLEDAKKFWQG